MCDKKNLKFRDYKKCLKVFQFENKINHLEKEKTDCLKLVKNKLILKTQYRFKSERHNVFIEVIN